MDEKLLSLAKECLSIISTSTAKDNEIKLLICSAIEDMERLDIDVEKNSDNKLIIEAIMMYVKGNFGNTDTKEKELCQKSYSLFLSTIASTKKYLKGN